MQSVQIDFNDAIYRATGIRAESGAMREVKLEPEPGVTYTLQATKINVGGRETLYLGLRNAYGAAVEDLQVKLSGRVLGVDRTKSQDAVVIEGMDVEKLRDLELISPSRSIHVKLHITLEEPLAPEATAKHRKKQEQKAQHTEKKRE